ncbi:hypothetical protein QBC39DRAFT_339913 [Podospora conica]|nr:hypothetical protein QBC39DRAFT_339913 [Schizothecium conicum]
MALSPISTASLVFLIMASICRVQMRTRAKNKGDTDKERDAEHTNNSEKETTKHDRDISKVTRHLGCVEFHALGWRCWRQWFVSD